MRETGRLVKASWHKSHEARPRTHASIALAPIAHVKIKVVIEQVVGAVSPCDHLQEKPEIDQSCLPHHVKGASHARRWMLACDVGIEIDKSLLSDLKGWECGGLHVRAYGKVSRDLEGRNASVVVCNALVGFQGRFLVRRMAAVARLLRLERNSTYPLLMRKSVVCTSPQSQQASRNPFMRGRNHSPS